METDRLDPVDRSRAWEPSDCNWPEFRQQTTSGLDKGDILMITPTRWQFKKKKKPVWCSFFFYRKELKDRAIRELLRLLPVVVVAVAWPLLPPSDSEWPSCRHWPPWRLCPRPNPWLNNNLQKKRKKLVSNDSSFGR